MIVSAMPLVYRPNIAKPLPKKSGKAFPEKTSNPFRSFGSWQDFDLNCEWKIFKLAISIS